MSKPIRRLGRGLDSLVSDLTSEPTPVDPPSPEPQATGVGDESPTARSAPTSLPTDALHPNPYQPRSRPTDAHIQKLAASIEQNGLLQPIVVRLQNTKYEIICGERRWWAAKSLGMERVPVVVREASAQQMLELALIENIQREDLNPIERAEAYRHYADEFGLSAEQIGVRMGEDRTTVVNYLRLLDLPAPIRRMVAENKLSMGHARCLAGVSDVRRQGELAESVASGGLSVRALEGLIRTERSERAGPASRDGSGDSPHLRDMEQRFERAIKTKVSIVPSRRKGRGRIVIEYYSLDDFDRIASALGVESD